MSFTRFGCYLFIPSDTVNSPRFIIMLYAIVLLALGGVAGAALLDARAQYRQLKQEEVVRRRELAAVQSQLKEQEMVLARLKSDPEYLERAIRQRVKYAKPTETIFRFPE